MPGREELKRGKQEKDIIKNEVESGGNSGEPHGAQAPTPTVGMVLVPVTIVIPWRPQRLSRLVLGGQREAVEDLELERKESSK